MIAREQIRAARALLDWSQKDLARNCGAISEPTIKLIETGKVHSKPETLSAIQTTFENAGLEFTPQRGVRFRDDLLRIIEGQHGENAFLMLLDDIYYDLKDNKGEALWSFIDEGLSPPSVIEKERLIREAGITYRNLIRHGDKNIPHNREEYRWLPKGYFLNNLTVIYGDKFAIVVNRPKSNTVEKIIIINDRSIAEMKTKEFEIIWGFCEKPLETAS